MSTKVLRLLAAIVLAASAACTSGPSPATDDAGYLKQIADARAEKDRFMREDADSPVPRERRTLLLPLRYYPPNPGFSVPAVLRLADQRPVVEMPTSTGTLRRMQRVGVLEFSLLGQSLSLAAFAPDGEQVSSLFVPFTDTTTGKQTYPAGRYLDLHPTATGIYTIDFNLAYNPSCAYDEKFECPYPPASNRLKVAVEAGEKIPGA